MSAMDEKVENISVADFSKHMFWDVNKAEIDLMRDRHYVVRQVFSCGLMNDWRLICRLYGIPEIGEIAKQIRDLDPKSHAFIALIAKIREEDFLCYTTKQSTPQHWNF